MTYQYLSDEPPETYATPGDIDKPVLLNPNKLKFLLLVEPSLEELTETIEKHALLRMEDRWTEILQPNQRGIVIQALQANAPKLRTLPPELVTQLLGVTNPTAVTKRLRDLSVEEQRGLVAPLKPKSVSEMLALYLDTSQIDQTGYRYFRHELSKVKSAREFFGNLTTALFTGFASTDYTLGNPKLGFHQPRIFEFLGMALERGWLLFPFITGESGTNEVRALMHRDNTRRYLNPAFGPQHFVPILEMLSELTHSDTGYAFTAKYAKFLTVCSTFRSIRNASTALFTRCADLVDNDRPDAHRQVGYARRCYNVMLLLHNSQHANAPRQAQLTTAPREVSLDEFASLNDCVADHPQLSVWAEAMSAFIRDNLNSPGLGVQRRSFCVEFLAFLSGLPKPPRRPEETERSLINDFTNDGPSFRNYMRKTISSAYACNSRLSQMAQFFGFIQNKLRVEHQGDPREAPWFANPVVMRFDRFQVDLKSGTTRKSIAADIIEEMRQVLIEDDYAWAKRWESDWAHLVNQDTKQLEYVWCPSPALCLYTLLSLPLRGLQGRMFDSGEGDAFIYDFESGTMVPNPNQLPVDDRIDPGRSEGFLQVMPSGLTSDPELLGLWICVNKTSDDGYPIPWYSEDLLGQLRYQVEWIQRYAPHPKTQTIEDAQGHRNTPKEWVDSQKRFYCLFRDPTVARVHDKSLPVSRQKLMKLWGKLSLAVQERINARATTDAQRVRLVKPGTEDTPLPFAIHDLHSLRVSGITDLLDRGVPLNIVSEYVAGHGTYIMTLWYDAPTPGAVRRALMQANERAGDPLGPLPRLLESEIADMEPFLVSHPDHQGLYTGFDALQENVGLIHVRHSGICPGTRCEEGGLTDNGRIAPVPVGDRGPSCPQCRFWLTGPAFLLGQAIEGNQLIMKIRSKAASLASCRQKIMDAEDAGDYTLADLLRGKNDVEERQLNNMLTEWWHRMRFYESSIAKLEAYRQSCDAKEASSRGAESIVLFKHHDKGQAHFGFGPATELELKHFLSTCAEILPSFADEALSAHQDIELAVGRFLAINDETELSSMFFKLDDAQRLTAANLAIELMQRATASLIDTAALLEGKTHLQSIPDLQGELKNLLSGGAAKAKVGTKRRLKREGSK